MKKFREDFVNLRRNKLDFYYQKINEKALKNKEEYLDMIFNSEKQSLYSDVRNELNSEFQFLIN